MGDLIVRRERVDLKLVAEARSVGGEALGEGAVSGTILVSALPGDHELARG